jgi:hypothetical protein
MTMMRNGLTAWGALVRGTMIGLALNLSILPMVQARQMSPPASAQPSLTSQTDEQSAMSILSDPEMRRMMASAILEQTAEAERAASCDGGIVSGALSAAENVHKHLFSKSVGSEDVVLSLFGSAADGCCATALSLDGDRAEFLAVSTTPLVLGSVPTAQLPAAAHVIAERFESVALVGGLLATDADVRVIRAVEFGWTDIDGASQHAMAILVDVTDRGGLEALDELPWPTEITSPSWACALTAISAAVALTACFACLAACVSPAPPPAAFLTCRCAIRACCAGLLGVLSAVAVCRGSSAELTDAIIAVGAVCATIMTFASKQENGEVFGIELEPE